MGIGFALSTRVHTQASGILGSLVARQAQTSGATLWAAKLLLFMFPPCTIQTSGTATARGGAVAGGLLGSSVGEV